MPGMTQPPCSLTGRRRTGRVVRPLRVLLVEDDEAQAQIFRYAVEAAGIGCDLRHASDGNDALNCLRSGIRAGGAQINLVLLDLRLPPDGGLVVLEAIKADPVLRLTPVVILSSSRLPTDRHAAYVRHANGYIVKPGDFDDLGRLTHDLLTYWSHWNEPAEEAC